MSTAGVLQIEILAGIARLSEDMKRAERVVGDSTGKMEKSVVSLQSQFSKLGMGMSIGLMIDEARRLTDSYTKVTAQMRIATAGQAEYAKGMEDVRRISTSAQSSIEATTMLYTRLTNSLKQHGATQQDVGRITESVSLGLKAYGATTAEAASAMLQLSQAFGSGRLGGEEFRAVSEAMPNMMVSLAKSMGVPKSALRDLSMQGKITSEVMMKAWNDPALIAALQKQAEMTRTITGEWVVLRNNLTMLVGEFMGASGSTAGITTAIRAMSDSVLFLGKNLDSVMNILSAYIGYLALLQVKSVMAWGQSRLVMMAHTQALAMNAAGEVARSVVVAAAATQETAARHLRLMAQREEFIASRAATLAELQGVLTAEARTAAELKYAASIEVVTTAHVQAIAMERERTTAMVASTAAEITRTSALAASGVAAIGWGTSVSAAIAMVGTAVSAAVLANPIGAAVLAIGAIALAIVNWETIVKASKATFDGFSEMINALKWGAEAASISMGKMFAQIQLGWMHTTKQITTEQYRAMWKQIEADAEQAKIDLIKIQKDGVDHEKLAAAERYAADRKDWEKLTNTKAQQRQAEIAALNEEYLKIITGQKLSQAEQLAEAERYNVALANINDKYNKTAVTAAGNAHTSKMEQMAIQMAAETNAEKGHLTNSQKVSLAWAELKHKEQTTQEALNYVKAQGIAIALDEKDAQAELQKQLDHGQVAYAKYWAEVATTTEKLKEHNDNLAFENSLIGQTKEQIVALTKLREDESLVKAQSGMVTLLSNEHTLAEVEAQKALIVELMRAKELREGKASGEAAKAAKTAETKAAKEALAEQTKAAEKQWKMVDGFAHTAFNNILDKGKNVFKEIGDAIKKYLLDMLYKMTVQKWMISVGMAGASGAAAAATNASNIGSMASGIQNLWNVGSSAVSSLFAPAATGMAAFTSAQMAGAVMSTSYVAPAMATLGAEAGAAASGLGALGSTIAAAVPYIGLAVAGVSVLGELFGGNKGPSAVNTGNAAMTFDPTGNRTGYSTYFGGSSAGTDTMITNMQTSYMKAAMALGIGTVATNFSFGGNILSNGQSPNFALGGGAVGGGYFRQGETPSSDAAIQLAASRAVFTALKGSDLPQYLSKMFDGLTAGSMTQQDIDNTLAFAGSVKQMREALLETRTPLEVLRANVNAGTAALATSAATFRTDFVAAIDAGINPQVFEQWKALGTAIDQLAAADAEVAAANLQRIIDANAIKDSLNQKYSTETDKLALAIGDITNTFAGLNLAVPDSQAALVELINGLDGTTASGQAALIAINGITGAIDTVIAGSKAMAEALKAAADAQNNLANAHTRLLTAQGDPVGSATASVGYAQIAYDAALGNLGASFGASLADTIAFVGRDLIGAAQKVLASGTVFSTEQQNLLATAGNALSDLLNAETALADARTAATTVVANVITAVDTSVADLARINLGWQQQIDVMTGARTQRQIDLANALVGADASTAALITTLFGLQDAATLAAEAAALAKTKLGWQNQLDVLKGEKTQTQIDRAARLADVTDAATIAIIHQVFALEDLKIAADASANATNISVAAAQKAADGAMASVSTAFGALQRAVKAERDAVAVAYETSSKSVADSIKTVSTAVDKLKSLSDALKSSLSGLIEPSRAAAQSQLASALAIARAGGALPTAESLQPALNAIAKPSTGLFTNFIDYQRDFIRTANDITSLGEITDKQLKAQRTQLDVLEAQVVLMKTAYDADMKQFDSVLTNAQNQIDVLNNIDNSVIGVAQAILKMADALRVADAAKEAAKLAPYKAVYSDAASVAGSSKAVNVTTGGAATGTTAGTVILTAGGQVALGLTGGWNSSQVSAQIASNIASFTRSGEVDKVNAIKDYAKSINLPGYAVGTNELLTDGAIFAHAGEEIKPRQFVEKDKSDKKETNELLRKLVAANDEMKKELVAIKSTNYKMWQIDDKHDIEGMPAVRAA